MPARVTGPAAKALAEKMGIQMPAPKRGRKALPVPLRGQRSAFVWIKLPMMPETSANFLYSHGKNGVYLRKEQRAYRKAVSEACLEQGIDHVAGRIRAEIWVHASHNNYDIDNVVKPCLDALAQCGVFENDRQIDELTVMRAIPSQLPYLMVHLRGEVPE